MVKWLVFSLIFFSSIDAMTLRVQGEGRSWETEISGSENVEALVDGISETFGIPGQFLVLYRDDPPYFDQGIDLRLHSSRRFDDQPQKTLKQVGLKEKSRVYFKVRPLKGDHIHQAYVIRIGDEKIPPLMDQRHYKPIHDAPYTDDERGVIEGGIYQKVYLHTGVHTHLDNLIHEHPWSSPFWFTFSEGLGANFGQFMQSVDLSYRQYPSEFSIEFQEPPLPKQFPGKKKFANGEKIDGKPAIWRLVVWTDHKNLEDKQEHTRDFDRVWLGHNMGMVTLQFGPEEDEVLPPPKEFMDFMMGGTFPHLKGFDERDYPSKR